ncbi:MAG TPA: aconitate hydratase [Planctomycetota bacterium]|nr:aconitate hydratase [Planctomycetota bacterium]
MPEPSSAELSRIEALYAALEESNGRFRKRLGRGLTLAEKILLGHLAEPQGEPPERGRTYADLMPDRVAMQDATAQMAILQFALAGRDQTAVPTTVHCDHLIRARSGRDADLATARTENAEVYAFLKSASARFGLGFWEPGSGIIHQVVLENYAFPGGMMIGTDSHTPNAGGLGMVAIGVGGADAMEVMAGLPFSVRWPKLIGVRLTGTLDGWTSPKDVILKVCEILTVKGGTGAIVEYFGPGTNSLSATGKGTICNMGAELGATTSLFPFDARMARYLRATGREAVAALAEAHRAALRADPEVEREPAKFFDRVIEIDLSTLPPLVVGPHTPDLARPLSDLAAEVKQKGWPVPLKAALIGSCTNSSYEDMERAAAVATQAKARGLKVATPLMVTPGSDTIDRTIRRDGQMQALADIGATVLANACGPCIGQWQRDDIAKGETNTILTSYNRNFSGRNDGNHQTLAFISSPEVVVALALAGRLDFDPRRDTLTGADGKPVRLAPPAGKEVPDRGLQTSLVGYVAPPADGRSVSIAVAPDSERLQLLEPFAPITPALLRELPVLVKVSGKCTTDHISPAGSWLRFRGHLANISNNAYIGATNAFTGEVGKGTNVLTGRTGVPLPELAQAYKAAGSGWVVVGDVNYGEGSSREHAAMSPRWLGCRAILARSFARIAETNLKKQGLLPLVFQDPAAWDLIRQDDRLSFEGIDELAPGSMVAVVARHADGASERFECGHSLNELQIEWFRAGSALNYLRERNREGAPAAR